MKSIRLIKLLIVSVIFLFSLQSCLKENGLAHCVIVEKEADFTGKWLKTDSSLKKQIVKVEECEKLDKELDQSDGHKKGKVRWANCLAGPDCDEAGNF